LLLIYFCGKPRGSHPAIKGRTLLAKLDFFSRYPKFLKLAGQQLDKQLSNNELGVNDPTELETVESAMVRYRYGPWDHNYYVVLSYLIGKGLISVTSEDRIEAFRLTDLGETIAEQVSKESAYEDLSNRMKTIYRLFNRFGGVRLKDFIYEHFSDILDLNFGATIGGKP